MTASITIGYATAESRPARIARTSPDGSVRTIQRRPGRTNARRRAIAESWGTGCR
jgi:hypothetical protein